MENADEWAWQFFPYGPWNVQGYQVNGTGNDRALIQYSPPYSRTRSPGHSHSHSRSGPRPSIRSSRSSRPSSSRPRRRIRAMPAGTRAASSGSVGPSRTSMPSWRPPPGFRPHPRPLPPGRGKERRSPPQPPPIATSCRSHQQRRLKAVSTDPITVAPLPSRGRGWRIGHPSATERSRPV
jgi:hypothetical protein